MIHVCFYIFIIDVVFATVSGTCTCSGNVIMKSIDVRLTVLVSNNYNRDTAVL